MRRALRDFVNRNTLLERSVHRLRVLRMRRDHPEGIVPPVPKRIVVEPTNFMPRFFKSLAKASDSGEVVRQHSCTVFPSVHRQR